MLWPQVHIALNHFPVVGTILATAFLAWVVITGQRQHVRMGLFFLAMMAVLGVAVYFTGEPTEEAVEHLAGVSEAAIELHEETARVSTIVLAIVGATALVGLFLTRGSDEHPRWLGPVVLALGLIASSAMAWTAHLGGEIRHPEIRFGDQAVPTSPEEPGDSEGR